MGRIEAFHKQGRLLDASVNRIDSKLPFVEPKHNPDPGIILSTLLRPEYEEGETTVVISHPRLQARYRRIGIAMPPGRTKQDCKKRSD